MRCYNKRISVFFVFVCGLVVLSLQLFRHDPTWKRIMTSSTDDETPAPETLLAKECLDDLKNEILREKLRTALTMDADYMLSILSDYLPNCSKKPPRKFVAYFIKLLSDAFDGMDGGEEEFESPWINRTHSANKSEENLCPLVSPLMQGKMNVTFIDTGEISDGKNYWNWPPTLEEVALEYQGLITLGGVYGPTECQCRGTTAIIIPYRDRDQHLRFFLHYTHEILRKQQLCYVIIVVEQDDEETFNKGQLMNTAFEYAKNLSVDFDCYVFHDVDIIAEDDRIIYTCRDGLTVNHIAPYIDKYSYELCCGVTVGAVVAFTKQQFEDLNGYSNVYAGWGGEDDDMDLRITFKGYSIWRSQKNYTRFKMIKHGKDGGNPDNENRMKLLETTNERQPSDGLNSLQTVITSVVRHPTHTRLKVKTYVEFEPETETESAKSLMERAEEGKS